MWSYCEMLPLKFGFILISVNVLVNGLEDAIDTEKPGSLPMFKTINLIVPTTTTHGVNFISKAHNTNQYMTMESESVKCNNCEDDLSSGLETSVTKVSVLNTYLSHFTTSMPDKETVSSKEIIPTKVLISKSETFDRSFLDSHQVVPTSTETFSTIANINGDMSPYSEEHSLESAQVYPSFSAHDIQFNLNSITKDTTTFPAGTEQMISNPNDVTRTTILDVVPTVSSSLPSAVGSSASEKPFFSSDLILASSTSQTLSSQFSWNQEEMSGSIRMSFESSKQTSSLQSLHQLSSVWRNSPVPSLGNQDLLGQTSDVRAIELTTTTIQLLESSVSKYYSSSTWATSEEINTNRQPEASETPDQTSTSAVVILTNEQANSGELRQATKEQDYIQTDIAVGTVENSSLLQTFNPIESITTISLETTSRTSTAAPIAGMVNQTAVPNLTVRERSTTPHMQDGGKSQTLPPNIDLNAPNYKEKENKGDGGGDAIYRTKPRKAVTMVMLNSRATDGVYLPARTKRYQELIFSKPGKMWTERPPSTTLSDFRISHSELPYGKTTTAISDKAPPDVYLEIELRMSWTDFCPMVDEFRKVLLNILDQRFGLGNNYKVELMRSEECSNTYNVMKRYAEIAVDVYVVNTKGNYDQRMTSKLAKSIDSDLFDDQPGPFKGKVIRVRAVGIADDEHYPLYQKEEPKSLNEGTVAGIAIACIISACLLGFIFFQMVIIARRRSIKKARVIMYDDGTRPSVELHSIEESIQMIPMSTPKLGRYTYVNQALETSDQKDYTSNCLTRLQAMELLKDPDSEDMEDEFLMLPNMMPKISTVPVGGELKNRYANVIPLQQTRVLLTDNGGDDYINANYIRGYDWTTRKYIATQAPMENTTVDFWNMIWHQQSQVILMLTGLEENGQSKCVEYWPNTERCDIVRIYGDFNVQLQQREVSENWIWSTLLLKNMEGNLHREVHHIWLTAWPTSGVPSDPSVVLDFLRYVRPRMEDSHGPTVVHCSPGTGRTGTLLAIDIGMKSYNSTHRIDVLQTVRQLREDRAGAIQTKEQYAFIYKALVHYANGTTTWSDISDAISEDPDGCSNDTDTDVFTS